MRLNQRRIVPAVVGEEEALAAAVASAVAVVEDAQAAVVAVDAKAEAEAVATIIKAMRGSPVGITLARANYVSLQGLVTQDG